MARVFRHILPLLNVLLLIVVIVPVPAHGQSIQIQPSPVPTPTQPPTPVPTPTPASRIVDSTYVSRHGWSITWGNNWESTLRVSGQTSGQGWVDDSLILRHRYLDIEITIQTIGSPAGACEALVKDKDAAVDANGEQLKSGPARTDTWIVVIGEAGSMDEGTGTYEECHFLSGSFVDQELVYMRFVATAPIDDFQEASIAFLQVSEDLLLD